MTDASPKWRRRALLAGGGLAAFFWVTKAPYLLSFGKPELVFETLPGLAPFRRLVGAGAPSTQNIALLGLDPPKPVSADHAALIDDVRSDPCTAIFGASQASSVPVAMFSDFACPICRVMETHLQDLKADSPDSFHIIRHQLPIFGTASRTASRAVLAADRQGAYAAMHARLLRTPAVTDRGYVKMLAQDIGLDLNRFLADLESTSIERELRLTQAIADVFGFYGTPAFVIGRTVFLGSVPRSTLQALIEAESGRACERV